MKSYSFFFLLIFLFTTGGQVFAINDGLPQITSEKSSFLKVDQSTQSSFFEEILFNEGFQELPEIKLSSVVFVFTKNHEIHFENKVRTAFFSSNRFQDKRNLIGQNIFPFHFFW